MDEIFTLLNEEIFSVAANDEYNSAKMEKITGFLIILFMTIISICFGFSVRNAIFVIKVRIYSNFIKKSEKRWKQLTVTKRMHYTYFIVILTRNVLKVLCQELLEKLHEIEVEVSKTERAFYGFLPTTLLPSIRLKETVAEHFDCVTIFHADILEFNKITSSCSAEEVIY